MQKNEVSVIGVSEVRWKGQGEIRSGDYTLYYSGGERAEKVWLCWCIKVYWAVLLRRLFIMTESLLLKYRQSQ